MQELFVAVIVRGLAVVFAICLCAACAINPKPSADVMVSPVTQGEETQVEQIQVELDIFSGNPNPMWFLAETEVVTFTEMLATLAPAPASDVDDGLGYRGFLITMTGSTQSAPTTIRVYNGIIQRAEDATTTFYSDPEKHVEHWLLTTGRPHLPEDLYELASTTLNE